MTREVVEQQLILYRESDYEKFDHIPGNRATSKGTIKNIASSMRMFGFLEHQAILVYEKDEKLVIIDGQHRFAAAQIVKLPILFRILDEEDARLFIPLNANQNNWTNANYLEYFKYMGKSNYIKLDRFKRDNRYGLTDSMCLLTNKRLQSTMDMVRFREGNFKIKSHQKAIEMVSMICDFQGIVNKYNKCYFMRAMITLINTDGYNHELMVGKIKSDGKNINNCERTDQFLAKMISVYNNGLPKEEQLVFGEFI